MPHWSPKIQLVIYFSILNVGGNVEGYLLKRNFVGSKAGAMVNGAVIQQIPVPSHISAWHWVSDF